MIAYRAPVQRAPLYNLAIGGSFSAVEHGSCCAASKPCSSNELHDTPDSGCAFTFRLNQVQVAIAHRPARRMAARCLMGWHDLKPVVRPWRPGPPPPGCRGLIRVRPTLRTCFHMDNVCRQCGERRGQ